MKTPPLYIIMYGYNGEYYILMTLFLLGFSRVFLFRGQNSLNALQKFLTINSRHYQTIATLIIASNRGKTSSHVFVIRVRQYTERNIKGRF